MAANFGCIRNAAGLQWLTLNPDYRSGIKIVGDYGEIVALGAEILPYMGPSEKWESP